MDENQALNSGEKAFFSVIPASVLRDKRLPANAKLLYGEIVALCRKEGVCWASNAYFARVFGVGIRTVNRWLDHLKKYGYINVEYPDHSDLLCKPDRVISVTENTDFKTAADTSLPMSEMTGVYDKNAEGGMTKMTEGYDKNAGRGMTKMSSEYDKNVMQNNTTNNTMNNTLNTHSHTEKDKETDIYGGKAAPEAQSDGKKFKEEADCCSPPCGWQKKTAGNTDGEFEKFWSVYPKKQGKDSARREYCKALRTAKAEEIYGGAADYGQYVRLNGITERYVKNPANWLNRRCWEDEYTPRSSIPEKDRIPIYRGSEKLPF